MAVYAASCLCALPRKLRSSPGCLVVEGVTAQRLLAAIKGQDAVFGALRADGVHGSKGGPDIMAEGE